MKNILADIELNDKQVRAFNEELNSWKDKKTTQIKEEVKSEYETEYQVKKRELEEEKAQFKAECEAMVEEITTKMQKVMVGRFTTALKGLYDELKVHARKDVLNDPRILALEEVKKVCYPLMGEDVTKGYVDELQNALTMLNTKDEEIDKLKAHLKLKEITSALSPKVAEAVQVFVSDAGTPEEVVERYSKLRNIVKEANDEDEDEEASYEDEDKKDNKKKKKKKSKKEKDEDEEDDEDEEEDDDEDLEESKKSKKDKDEEDDEEDDEDEDEDEDEEEEEEEEEEEDLEEDLEIKPSFHMNRKGNKKEDYVNTLNEMLDLAGVERD